MLVTAATLHRTARIAIRATKAQRRRCFGLLRSAGDVRALVLDCNRQLREWKLPPVVSYRDLCREVAGMAFGELGSVGARSVIRRYSEEWFEAARRRKAGTAAGFPRRKKALLPVRYYHGTFRLDGERLRIPVAGGSAPLVLRLGRAVPYPQESVRSVTLLCEAGRLYVDVTAALQAEDHGLDPGTVAGVDPGIIHPFAVVSGGEALLVSGRGLRAECHLHLADTKARARHMGRKAPRKGQRGSRRWRKLRRAQRRAEARHRRRIHQGQHEAARAVVAWAIDHTVGTLRVGDPEGICNRGVGRRQNLRLRNWRRTHLIGALKDKAALARASGWSRWTSGGPPRRVCSAGGGSPSRGAGASPARTVDSGGTGTSSVPQTSPQLAAERSAGSRGSSTVGWGLPPHGVTGDGIVTMSAGPAWPMAAGSRWAPGVARRRARSGGLVLPWTGPVLRHQRSARIRLPPSSGKRAKDSGQGIRRGVSGSWLVPSLLRSVGPLA